MGTRIRGENVSLKIIKGGVDLLVGERAVVSLEFTPQQEITDTGFLGETTNRKDEVYKGCSGTIVVQHSDPTVTDLVRDLNDRARRQIATFKVNILATEEYPDGTSRRILFPNVMFGPPAKSYSSRDAYGTISLPWAVDDYQVLQ